jgi:S-adenosylhomocysteine hydrolase
MQKDLHLKSRDELILMWQKLFRSDPPATLNKSYMIKHLTWQEQAQKHGGLSATSQKCLEKLVKKYKETKDIKSADIKTSQPFSIQAGTKLIREFKSQKHEVTALEKGFSYNDKNYKSLSAIANEITGTRWNGKKFFGVAS